MAKSLYVTHTNTTPQTEPLAGREAEMAKNNAGGYSFKAGDFARLDRFLILGTEGGTYYVGERKLTRENAGVVLRCIQEDGVRVVNRIVEISDGGLAPKNDPAIFALALAAKNGDDATRALAYKAVPKVCRIGTHLFQFAEAIDSLGGWGRGARKAVGSWYTDKGEDKLAYQLVKYRQRNGFSHADLLRLSHPNPSDGNADLLRYAAGKLEPEKVKDLPKIIQGYELAKNAKLKETVGLIHEFNIPREAINTEYLGESEVLEALLYDMPLTALIRNLGNLTKAGVIAPFSDGTKRAVELLSNEEALQKSRVHPMAIYLAMMTYGSGQGVRGNGSWTPVQSVMDALDNAFYATMSNVTPSGKEILFVVDTSGSMGGFYRSKTTYDLPIAKAAAMALIAAKTEVGCGIMGVDTSVQPLPISPRMRLDDAIKTARQYGGGGTNLSLPYEYLRQKKFDVDGVVVFTDSETWAGNQHASESLKAYRKSVAHPVRNVVASMEANGYTIGDPKDDLTLQCVGLDASLPRIISGFMAGEF